jgi:hypothetical protein
VAVPVAVAVPIVAALARFGRRLSVRALRRCLRSEFCGIGP